MGALSIAQWQRVCLAWASPCLNPSTTKENSRRLALCVLCMCEGQCSHELCWAGQPMSLEVTMPSLEARKLPCLALSPGHHASAAAALLTEQLPFSRQHQWLRKKHVWLVLFFFPNYINLVLFNTNYLTFFHINIILFLGCNWLGIKWIFLNLENVKYSNHYLSVRLEKSKIPLNSKMKHNSLYKLKKFISQK